MAAPPLASWCLLRVWTHSSRFLVSSTVSMGMCTTRNERWRLSTASVPAPPPPGLRNSFGQDISDCRGSSTLELLPHAVGTTTISVLQVIRRTPVYRSSSRYTFTFSQNLFFGSWIQWSSSSNEPQKTVRGCIPIVSILSSPDPCNAPYYTHCGRRYFRFLALVQPHTVVRRYSRNKKGRNSQTSSRSECVERSPYSSSAITGGRS